MPLVSKFWVVFVLGFLSGLPMSLFSTTLQAWFAQSKHSVLFVSSLSLLQLPFLIRFLWGPLLDKYFLHNLGRRKTWLLITQFSLFLSIEAMALFNPNTHALRLLILAFAMTWMASIQDVVIDAHRIEYMPSAYYGFAAVTAVYAYRLALLLSGGLSLIFADYYGFAVSYHLLGLCFVLGMLVVYFSEEPPLYKAKQEQTVWMAYQALFKTPWCLSWMGLILCLKFGEVFVANTSPMIIPFMMNALGLSLSKIAYINKIFGLLAQLLGGLLSAALMLRFSLMRLLLYLGGMQALSNLGFVFLSSSSFHEPILWILVIFENLSSGMTATILVACLMKIVDKEYTASQFSFWMIFVIMPRFIAGPIGGYIVHLSTWSNLFICSTILSCLYIVFWAQLQRFKSSDYPGLKTLFMAPR